LLPEVGWPFQALEKDRHFDDVGKMHFAENAHVPRLLVEPSIVAAVEQNFAVPARIYFGMVSVVPARGATGLPWRQADYARLATTGEKDPSRIRASELASILNPVLGKQHTM
jgi:hypothetical protein